MKIYVDKQFQVKITSSSISPEAALASPHPRQGEFKWSALHFVFVFVFCFFFLLFFVFVQHGPPEADKKKCGGHEELGEGEELVVNSTRMIPPNTQKHNEKYKHWDTKCKYT